MQLNANTAREGRFRFSAILARLACLLLLLGPTPAEADPAATAAALRMAGTVTGGLLPASSPQFAQMVSLIQGGDYYNAALTAINTPYFAKFLVRQMAKEMQNPTLQSAGVPDSDASTFVVAHLLYGSGSSVTNTGVSKGISALWSDNLTCLVNVAGTPTSAFKLSATQLEAVNWDTQLVCTAGQKDTQKGATIPAQHVGGYMTLSSSAGDGSFAQNAFTAGTNLRGVEYMYEIAMGLSLLQMGILDGAVPSAVPAFVPEGDPNFLVGTGQPACIQCHASGASNLTHGYAAFADIFDFDPTNGFVYIASPATSTMKSLGSMSGTRSKVASCIANHAFPSGFATCNPDSLGLGTTSSQNWDLTSWQTGGLLSTMGWTGPIKGTGLNALGMALGQASLVYQFMVQRVINDICPTGSVSSATIASIAQKVRSRWRRSRPWRWELPAAFSARTRARSRPMPAAPSRGARRWRGQAAAAAAAEAGRATRVRPRGFRARWATSTTSITAFRTR
jgi:hypothetical protein